MATAIQRQSQPRLPKSFSAPGVANMKNASIDTLLSVADEVVESVSDTSNVFNTKLLQRIPQFHKKEVVAHFCVKVSKFLMAIPKVQSDVDTNFSPVSNNNAE